MNFTPSPCMQGEGRREGAFSPVWRRTLSPTLSLSTGRGRRAQPCDFSRSEEHTSELQSPCNLVCRLLLEKKKTIVFAVRLGALHHLLAVSPTFSCAHTFGMTLPLLLLGVGAYLLLLVVVLAYRHLAEAT